MKQAATVLVAFLLFSGAAHAQQVTGLSGWDIFLDPGHSQRENMGVFGYSEAEKVLRVGLALREMLLETTDIDTVYMSRTNDQQSVSLSQRVDHANAVGAAHYHSIHSNAAAPDANFEFVLWPQYPDGSEAVPNGGRRMSVLMADLLGRSMRIPSRGDYGECDFYGASSCRSRSQAPKGSRNYVQGYTVMPSELSEAGFHTNPAQNMRNMNAEWKRLEAKALYWSILAYHGLPRPPEHIATGFVTDVESGRPINGAVVTVGDRVYVTDTYESLFHRYSNDPDLLRNGFYYLEDVDAGALPVAVAAEGYESYAGELTPVDTFFTFHDVQLVSTALPVVEVSAPAPGADRFPITAPIVVDFTRQMERASVEAAFALDPETTGRFVWSQSDTRLIFVPDTLAPLTDYTLTIGGTAVGRYGHAFDGDADGTAGGDFTMTFQTGFPDVVPPRLVASTPRAGTQDVEVHPVLTLVYDETVERASLDGRVGLATSGGGAVVDGDVAVYEVDGRTVVSFFPLESLAPNTWHELSVEAGVRDVFGNEETARKVLRFRTGDTRFVTTVIDAFEGDVEATWWAPQQSGTTGGIVTDSTFRTAADSVAVFTSGGTSSLALRYGWNTAAGDWLIREYLADGTAPKAVTFDDTYLLQAYVFGDGSGNQFRFALDDNVPASAASNHEVSPWYTVDWTGWRLVTWDLAQDGTGTWIGDGSLDGRLGFDSIQLTHVPGAAAFGTLYFDDLRVARRESATVAREPEAAVPERYTLHQNYPNPFNPATTVRFELSAPQDVRLAVFDVIGREVAVLASGRYAAGAHEVTWDARDLPSGVYLYRLDAGAFSQTRKLILQK